jgi:hypothetical protein
MFSIRDILARGRLSIDLCSKQSLFRQFSVESSKGKKIKRRRKRADCDKRKANRSLNLADPDTVCEFQIVLRSPDPIPHEKHEEAKDRRVLRLQSVFGVDFGKSGM